MDGIVPQRVDGDRFIPWAITSAALGQFITKSLRVRPAIARIQREQSLRTLQILSVENEHMTSYQYACVLSTLPYVQSIRTVRFTGRGSWWLTELQLCWLAYALFHPRTKASAWKKLALDKADMRYAMDTLRQITSCDETPLLSATKLALMEALTSLAFASEDFLEEVSQRCPHLETLSMGRSTCCISTDSLRRYFSHSAAYNLRSIAISVDVCDMDALAEILCDQTTYPAAAFLKELRIDGIASDRDSTTRDFVQLLEKKKVSSGSLSSTGTRRSAALVCSTSLATKRILL